MNSRAARIARRIPPAGLGVAALLVAVAPTAAAGSDMVNVTGVDANSVQLVYICVPGSDVARITVGVYPQQNTPEATGVLDGPVCDGTQQTADIPVGGVTLPSREWVRVRVKMVTSTGITGMKLTRKMLMP